MGISKYDKQALSDLFIHMGVPLVKALQTVESWSGGDGETVAQRAEKLSKLLNLSVEFATKITKKLEIRDSYTLENVRGKIIRIVTPIVADQYISNGEMPKDNDLKDVADLFDVLISFAESVSPTDEKGSKPQKIAMMVEACEPIISAVSDNDLGLGSDKIFKDIVTGLNSRAEQLCPTLGLEHAIETGLLKAMVPIFVSCYQQTVDKGGSLDDVWTECDQRLVLIQSLTGFVAEKANIKTDKPEAKPAVASETKEKPAKVDSKKEDNKDETQKKEPEQSDDKSDDDDDDGDFNPMSFFSTGG